MILILIILLIPFCLGLIEINQSSNGIEICDFYKNAEDVFHCGKNGLFQKMGIKYCNVTFDPSEI